MKNPKITQDRLKELLTYDSSTGIFKWRKEARTRGIRREVAGCQSRVYILIRVDGVLYPAHQLAWLYVHGEFVSRIDHKDLNGSNNAIENLRPSTQSQNCANTKIRSHNTTGFKGVQKLKNCKNRWMAQIRKDKKSVYLGTFGSPEEAHEAYKKAADSIFGEFARY